MPRKFKQIAVLAAAAALGCANQPDSKTGPSGTAGSSAVPVDAMPGCATVSPGPSPLRRLTRFEYNNTVADLFGDATSPASRFPPEEESLGFDNDANVLRVPLLLAEGYLDAARGLSEAALSSFPAFVGCDPALVAADATAQLACVSAFVGRFGERLLRRPVGPEQQERLLAVYSAARAELDFAEAVRAVLETMLISPQFLYRVEAGQDVAEAPGVQTLDGFSMASRLSYFLWGSLPDAALMDAAKAGQLATRDQVRAQAERMYDSPRTRGVVRHFHDYWLTLLDVDSQGKDPALFPDYSARIGVLLRKQTEAFAEHLYFEGQGDFGLLMTAPFTFMNQELASYFGIQGPSGDALVRVELDATRHAGLVTQPSILSWYATANRTHPILRGKFIRERFLCDPPPTPPENIVDMRDAAAEPNATERQRLSAHRSAPACAGCHTLMDPIGFGLENFDASGRYRETENAAPVDASGEIVGTDVAGPYNGPIELAHKLAASEQAQACLAAHWFRFASGRAETPADACATAALSREFQSHGRSLRELVLAITQTDAFMYRTRPAAGEGTL